MEKLKKYRWINWGSERKREIVHLASAVGSLLFLFLVPTQRPRLAEKEPPNPTAKQATPRLK